MKQGQLFHNSWGNKQIDLASIKPRPCGTNKLFRQSTSGSHCVVIYYKVPPTRAKNVCIYITLLFTTRQHTQRRNSMSYNYHIDEKAWRLAEKGSTAYVTTKTIYAQHTVSSVAQCKLAQFRALSRTETITFAITLDPNNMCMAAAKTQNEKRKTDKGNGDTTVLHGEVLQQVLINRWTHRHVLKHEKFLKEVTSIDTGPFLSSLWDEGGRQDGRAALKPSGSVVDT